MSRKDNLLDLTNPARVIQVAGKRFSVGLLWQPLLGLASIKQEVVEFAEAESMNLAVVYQQTETQAGFIAAPDEVKLFAGTYSLAAVLAEQMGDSWLGVFEVDNSNWVMVAVHDGMIVPGCDVIGSRSEIENLLIEIGQLNPWANVYVSDEGFVDSIDINGGYELTSLDKLLAAKKYKRSNKIFEVREGISKRTLFIGGVVVALLSVGLVGKLYMDNVQSKNQHKLSMLAQLAKSRKAEQDRVMWRQRVVDAAPKPSWHAQPSSHALLGACDSHLSQVSVNVAGWPLQTLNCTPKAFTATYGYKSGTSMADFHRAAQIMKNQQLIADFSVTVEDGTLTFNPMELPIRGEEAVAHFPTWSLGWLSLFQLIGVGSNLTHTPVPIPGPVSLEAIELLGMAEATPTPPWWIAHSWSFSTSGMNPSDILKQVPGEGLVIDSITAQVGALSNWSWRAEGKIYTK